MKGVAIGLLVAMVLVGMGCQHSLPEVPTYTCHRATGEIKIDGKMDDQAWKLAEWASDFMDVRGPWYAAPSLQTRCKLLWDDKALYIAAEIEEPDVWGTMTEYGSHLYDENNFEVFLDPAASARNYWELEINPLNTVWSLQMDKPYSEGGALIPGTELKGLRTAIKINGTVNDPKDMDQGWVAEIAIPWSSLTSDEKAPKTDEQWRMLLCRIEWDLKKSDGKYVKVTGGDHYWSWSATGDIAFHVPQRYGYLKFAP
jgi:hypothetical protein